MKKVVGLFTQSIVFVCEHNFLTDPFVFCLLAQRVSLRKRKESEEKVEKREQKDEKIVT